jgi:transposase InsO family protein
MCQVLNVVRNGFYQWKNRKPSKRLEKTRAMIDEIYKIHDQFEQTYGSPRMWLELLERGIEVSLNTVAKWMREIGVKVKTKKKFVRTTDSKHQLSVAENLLNQDFQQVSRKNEVWLSDITYIKTKEGWLYLAAIKDLFTRKIVGWSMGDHMKKSLVCDALKMAYANEQPEGELVHHSDRGSQYCSEEYQKLLRDKNIQTSMSRKGNCYDNAPMESFFATLKKERVHRRKYETRAEAKQDIFQYIECFYNRVRRHSGIGYMSPVEYESQLAS